MKKHITSYSFHRIWHQLVLVGFGVLYALLSPGMEPTAKSGEPPQDGVEYSYNNLHRLERAVYHATGLTIEYTYDNVGNILRVATRFRDTDNDGLPDYWERLHHLNPLDPSDASADWDTDGLSNLAEFHHGTNPNKSDSDGDGMSDSQEIIGGTDPTVPNDACPSDPDKTVPGICGCGVTDTDTDHDGMADCNDACPADSAKASPGVCGCGKSDIDANGNGIIDCTEIDVKGNDAFTILLLSSETFDGDLSIIDSSAAAQLVQPFGDTHHSADSAQFGFSSLYFDGDGDYLALAPRSDWDFGATDFTIDFWANFSEPLERPQGFLAVDSLAQPSWSLAYNGSALEMADDTGENFFRSEPWTPVANEWAHIAVVRSRGLLSFFVNGIRLGMVDVTGHTFDSYGNSLVVGSAPDVITDFLFHGYLEEFRISKGITRWTEEFTPPGAPYSECHDTEADWDNDGQPDCLDPCPADPSDDADRDGVCADMDGCPSDPGKTAPGICGCGVADTDTDQDGVADCNDACPADPVKTAPGICGCGVVDIDTDQDGVADCNDACPTDPAKTASGICGCGVADTDTDHDGAADCNDTCPADPTRTDPGIWGCNVSDVVSIPEGSAFVRQGSLTSPNLSGWTGTVDYGDGSGIQPLTLNQDRSFNLNHIYMDNGVYTMTVTLVDGAGARNTYTVMVTVTNMAPTLNAGSDTTINYGQSFTGVGSFSDPGADAWTATVDYGDGTGSKSLALKPDKTFNLSNLYATAGTFTVRVTVTDDEGSAGSDTLTVTVTPALSPICGDLDHDRDVDERDKNMVFAAFRFCAGQAGYLAEADYDKDGCITFNDYREWYKCYLAYLAR